MAAPNPEYKPDWEEVHDFHNAERQRLDAEKSAIQDQENELFQKGVRYDAEEMLALNEQMKALSEEWDHHHTECLRCLDRYQHETVQDAAKWLFDRFDPNMGTIGSTTIHQIDFDQFQTIDEVHEAWSRASDVSKQMESKIGVTTVMTQDDQGHAVATTPRLGVNLTDNERNTLRLIL